MWQSQIMASAELSSVLNTGHNSFTNNALCYFALHDTNVDSAGELKSAEICVPHMPSLKAKQLGKFSREKVLLER